MNAYLNQYKKNMMASTTPEQILVMLYDGAIRFVSQAQMAVLENNHEVRAKHINKTIAILSELAAHLDHEIGGEIAANLDALYHFMIKELCRANLRNNAKPLKVVESLLTELRDTWKEAIRLTSEEKSAEARDYEEPAEYRPLNIGAV